MAVTYHEETSLFELPADGFSHGCNTKGGIGGLANEVFSRLPDMKEVYKMACLQGTFEGGDIFPCDFETFWVYNLFTQEEPGANAEIGFVTHALEKMREHMKENQVRTMNIPQIGCGIGGLDWSDVREQIEDVFGPDDAVILQVVTQTTFD